jgi:hypothetical protein
MSGQRFSGKFRRQIKTMQNMGRSVGSLREKYRGRVDSQYTE